MLSVDFSNRSILVWSTAVLVWYDVVSWVNKIVVPSTTLIDYFHGLGVVAYGPIIYRVRFLYDTVENADCINSAAVWSRLRYAMIVLYVLEYYRWSPTSSTWRSTAVYSWLFAVRSLTWWQDKDSLEYIYWWQRRFVENHVTSKANNINCCTCAI